MTDKEKIKAEIDKIINDLTSFCTPDPMGNMAECMAAAQIEALNLVKDYIDSMQEEPASEDLLDEIHNKWEDDPHINWPRCPYKDFKNIAFHFAHWQREQMMKDAVEGIVMDDGTGLLIGEPWEETSEILQKMCAKDGDKVKIIFVKED